MIQDLFVGREVSRGNVNGGIDGDSSACETNNDLNGINSECVQELTRVL